MARSSHGPRLTSVAATPPRPPEVRVVRMGSPANDNGMRTPVVYRLLAVATTAALAFLVLRWLEIL
jgi:hypothetical protein